MVEIQQRILRMGRSKTCQAVGGHEHANLQHMPTVPQMCGTGLEGTAVAGGSRSDQHSHQGQSPEACRRWENGKCFKPWKYPHLHSVCNGSHKKINCLKFKRRQIIFSYKITQPRIDYWNMDFN